MTSVTARDAAELLLVAVTSKAQAEDLSVTVVSRTVNPAKVVRVVAETTWRGRQAGGFEIRVRPDRRASIAILAAGDQRPFLRRTLVLDGAPARVDGLPYGDGAAQDAALDLYARAAKSVVASLGGAVPDDVRTVAMRMPEGAFGMMAKLVERAVVDMSETLRHQKELEADAFIAEAEAVLAAMATAGVEDPALTRTRSAVENMRARHRLRADVAKGR